MSRPFALSKAVLCGATVATLVFFPLINALAVNHGYWLHWRTQDTVETLCAWVLVAGLVVGTITLPAALGRPVIAEAVNAAWLLIGGYSAMGAVVKTAALREFALAHRASSPWIAVALLSCFGAFAVTAWLRWQGRGGRPLERVTLALSPLCVVFAIQLGNAQWHHLAPVAGVVPLVSRTAASSAAPRVPVRTLILVLDELSRDYLYGDRAAVLGQLPALRRLVAESTVFGGAYLPGGETKVAVPALFGQSWLRGGEPLDTDELPTDRRSERRAGGWLDRASNAGLDVRVFGWYLDYCTGIAASAAECRSVSLYNWRTMDDRFSLLHPLLTTLCLLPSDAPFGWLKDAPARRMHLATYELAKAWMAHELREPHADVVYVHVNVPHVPFLEDGVAGRERFVSTIARYVAQLRYVDTFVALALEAVSVGGPAARPTRVVVMSDHNARQLTPPAVHERVVFMVREPGGVPGPRDDRRLLASELLSRTLVEAP